MVPIYDRSGNQLDPTGATSVLLHYRIDDETAPAVEVVGTVVVVLAGTPAWVQYVFQGSDTANPGFYDAEFIVAQASGEVVTSPACAGRPKYRFAVFAKP